MVMRVGVTGRSPVRSPKDDVWHWKSTLVDDRRETLMKMFVSLLIGCLEGYLVTSGRKGWVWEWEDGRMKGEVEL
jgi:hypothetical protein